MNPSRISHIDREFTPHPRKLPRVGCDLLDPARMWFSHIHRISPQGIDHLQVLLEHIWVLVIFARDVLSDRGRQGEGIRLAKGQEEDIAGRC